MKKNAGLFDPPYPYWHHTTIGRLESILRRGIVSQRRAKELGISGYRKQFDSSWNKDCVSLMSGQSPRKATAPGVAILVSRDVPTIMAKGRYKENDKNRPVPKERLVKDYIPPEKFLGVSIGEVGYSFRLERPVPPRAISQKKVIEIVNRVGRIPVFFKGKKIN